MAHPEPFLQRGPDTAKLSSPFRWSHSLPLVALFPFWQTYLPSLMFQMLTCYGSLPSHHIHWIYR